jgi:dipeptide/tripeptide permease
MYTREEIHNFEGKYPKQLLHLAGSEMWERFCFYGMRGMLTVFMVTQLGLGRQSRQPAIRRDPSLRLCLYLRRWRVRG